MGSNTVAELAFDENNNIIYGSDTTDHQLISIDPNTGDFTIIGAFPTDLSSIVGLAFDSATGTLYGHTAQDGLLVTIDTVTAETTPIGVTAVVGPLSLTFDFDRSVIYGFDINSATYFTIDPLTAETTVSTYIYDFENRFGNIAFDRITHQFIFLDQVSREIITLNRDTSGVAVGPKFGFYDVVDITFNANENFLYGFDEANDVIFKIDTSTGLAKGVKRLDPNVDRGGIAYDPNSDTLYSIRRKVNDFVPGALLAIKLDTNQVTVVGTVIWENIRHLEFDATTNTLYGLNNYFEIGSNQNPSISSVFAIDTSNANTVTPRTSTYLSLMGLAVIPD